MIDYRWEDLCFSVDLLFDNFLELDFPFGLTWTQEPTKNEFIVYQGANND